VIILIAGIGLVSCIYYFDKNDCSKQSEDILIKNQTQQAISMLETVYEGYQDGMYDFEQAKSMGASLLRNLRYGDHNEGYFWTDTSKGDNVVHAIYRDLEGKNRIDAQMDGIYYMRGIIDNGQKPGGGYTDYLYPKPGGEKHLEKRAYSLYFEPFDWIVGTGYYLEDLK
jgi:methyl-accepting chemotaxis protein